MTGDLIPRTRNTPVRRETARALQRVAEHTRVEQASIRATSAVAEFAMSEVTFLKRTQRELEQAVPDATEALNLIATTATMAIARNVHRFGEEVAG